MEKNNFSDSRIALAIFAHDESLVIKDTVQAAQKALRTGDALFVIADNCTDDTSVQAQNGGARVLVRENESLPGKGAALSWFVKTHWLTLKDFSRIVVLDADSHISPDFIEQIKTNLKDTNLVVQCFIHPIHYEDSPISTLGALSEFVEQSVYDRFRTFLGWSIRLRGTGMVINPAVLLSICQDIKTEVEDIALSLLIAGKNIKVKRFDAAVIYDPKPTNPAATSRQRARWFRGQWNAFWIYRTQILEIIARGPDGWSLIESLFCKPRWLMIAIKLGLACLCFPWPALATFFGFMFAMEFFFILLGVFQLPQKKTFFKALLYTPSFVWMWLKGILLSCQGLPWLRVREVVVHTEPMNYKPQNLLKSTKGN